MEILWCTKAPRADIYSQFVSALRTAAGASSADRVGRDPCVPPRSTHCSRRGTRVPPYRVRRSHGADRVVRPYTFCAGRRTPRAFVPLRSTAGRRPLRTLSLRASPRREASALGVQTGAAIRPICGQVAIPVCRLIRLFAGTARCRSPAPSSPPWWPRSG